jgi:L-serine dehydratase
MMDRLRDATKKYPANINGKTFMISHDMIIWDKIEHSYPYANTMIMRLVGKDGSALFEREYYSPGGGFFLWKGQPKADRGKPLYPYTA